MGQKNKRDAVNEQDQNPADSSESAKLFEEIVLPTRVRLNQDFVFCKEHPHGASQLIQLHKGQIVDDPELIKILYEHGILE